MFYAASDVAFVAGSLVPIGGHNLLEPAMLGVPIVTGPHNFNAQDIADLFVDLGACRRVAGTEELVTTVSELLTTGTSPRSWATRDDRSRRKPRVARAAPGTAGAAAQRPHLVLV